MLSYTDYLSPVCVSICLIHWLSFSLFDALVCGMVSALILSTAGKEFPRLLIAAGWMGHQWFFVILGSVAMFVFTLGWLTVWWRTHCLGKYGEYRELFHSPEQRRKLVYFALGVFAILLLLVALISSWTLEWWEEVTVRCSRLWPLLA
jgi:hypothetical protein